MRPPGDLDDLGREGRDAWKDLVASERGRILADLSEEDLAPTARLEEPGEISTVRTIDWPAFPIRVATERSTGQAMAMLDQRDPVLGDIGRVKHQEEYAEWRLIHEGERLRGIEVTTELPEYWRVMAAHEPERTLQLASEFAGHQVDAGDVYGSEVTDPRDLEPQGRADAFARRMLRPREGGSTPPSPYNDGRAAFCCMAHRSNTLGALLELLLSAARRHFVEDGVTGLPRFPSGSEAIAALRVSAQDGRNSDPLLVERIVRFAGEGLRVGLDDPAGVYIRELQLHELEQPDGEDLPGGWLEFGRGPTAAESPDGRPRCQRLKLLLPADADFSLDDMVIRRTGEPIRHGGQMAELIQVCAYLRTEGTQAQP